MTPEVSLAKAVNSVVQTYVKRCYWVDPEELRQEAWLAAFVAFKKWQPERGPLDRYAYVTIRHHVAAFVVRDKAPVSASWHKRHELIGVGRAELVPQSSVAPPENWADSMLSDERWRVRVLARLLDVLGPNADDALDLLLGNRKRAGRRPRALEEQIRQYTDTIRADEELRAIWKERHA